MHILQGLAKASEQNMPFGQGVAGGLLPIKQIVGRAIEAYTELAKVGERDRFLAIGGKIGSLAFRESHHFAEVAKGFEIAFGKDVRNDFET